MTTPMAPAGCHTHRHASRDSYYMNMISYITYISFIIVGGNRPPQTPMGPEPLLGSAGSGGCTKSRSRRHTHKDFTQLRAARMRKTILLLVWIDSGSCSRAQEATVSLELDVDGCLSSPLLRRMG